ncbi:MAG TPA: C4-type zinc ribbon domain-containing protein [Candidatus Nitrosotalea sp.]|jgi:predicted  nucleic acid-binding Zn-ribbon protein|nr:C4-type zinc ribbon domain-containing protein [Candidatus Nitrosotalea sp.]
MDQQLQTLINLQAIDTRIAALEADAARLPKEIAAIHAAVEEAKKQVEQAKTRLDAARKDQRAKEKDLEVVQAKRVKNEARLYEVKTNKEYSAVLIEIEDIKQEKARMEEEVLVLMESQERLTGDIREAESRFKQRETQGRSDEATLKEQLRGIEVDLAAVRTERKELAAKLPGNILADYDRILRARAGLALVPVAKPNFCGACRMTITPQRLQELRAQSSLIPCESCGRYLYWPS